MNKDTGVITENSLTKLAVLQTRTLLSALSYKDMY